MTLVVVAQIARAQSRDAVRPHPDLSASSDPQLRLLQELLQADPECLSLRSGLQ